MVSVKRLGVRRLATSMLALAGAFFLESNAFAEEFFPLNDIRPGMRGVGRTVFHDNRVEEFQVEILGILENLTPRQSIVLARLSGGPLAETGVMQGMSGSPVYLDGRLLGAIALGFPFSKQPIAGIQPIGQMISDVNSFGRREDDARLQKFPVPAHTGNPGDAGTGLLAKSAKGAAARHHSGKELARSSGGALDTAAVLRDFLESQMPDSGTLSSSFGNLKEIFTPLALSGFSESTVEAFAAQFRRLGLQPQLGVGGGSARSQPNPGSVPASGSVLPGSMISVQLLSGDMSISADGTVTMVDGKKVYAFGHRFLDSGTTDLPFARADVVALLPTLNSSFKLSAAREFVGSITSDRSTAIAGEIGRPARLIPLTIDVQGVSRPHTYRLNVVNDRLLTSFITQTALFATLDATERTLGGGTLQLRGRIEFEGDNPPLLVHDTFVSDTGVALQATTDAVATLAFTLGSRFSGLQIKSLHYQLEPLERRRQLRVVQAWASRHAAHPGDTIQITALLQGDGGSEITRTADYLIPPGAPGGALNLTVSDAITLNAPDFAGMNANSFPNAGAMIEAVNQYRSSDAAYVRVWRQEPAFTVSGPAPGSDLTDPPPSVALILADPSASASGTAAIGTIRGATLKEIRMPVNQYVVTGAKTIQVEIKD